MKTAKIFCIDHRGQECSYKTAINENVSIESLNAYFQNGQKINVGLGENDCVWTVIRAEFIDENKAFGFNVNPELSMTDRLKLAGVKINNLTLSRNGIEIQRPNVENAPSICFAIFNVII